MDQKIKDLAQVLWVAIDDLNKLAKQIEGTFASINHSFDTLEETVYSAFPKAAA